VALQTLDAVAERDAYANLALPAALRRAGLHGRDAAFATELTYGTLRGIGTYDAVLAACVDRPLDEVDPLVLAALRLGAHQILNTRVPVHAAVSETVEVVRAAAGGQASARFVNAVLRRVAGRELREWLQEVAPGEQEDPDGHLAVVHSHPEWIVRALRDSLVAAGRDRAELPDLLDANNARSDVTLVALPGLTAPADLVEAGGRPGTLSPLAAHVSGAVDEVEAVRVGRARVQDEGSQLVTLALADVEVDGDRGRWLDLCAGPGGKAAVLAATLAVRRAAGTVPADARLVAVEPLRSRAHLVSAAVAAVPGDAEVRQADGRTVGQEEPSAYDRVLVDAPCTGLGALRRRPEARWRRTPQDLAALAPLQRDLLSSALDAVRPGGVVAYVTCSPHPAENRLVVDDVLRRRDDVLRLDAAAALEAVAQTRLDLGPGPDAQLWPHLHGTDAMYLALLRRGTPVAPG
jgi:16S rRNA (cytosine967-C5)-methyltransferase